jgi:hypothetical protein
VVFTWIYEKVVLETVLSVVELAIAPAKRDQLGMRAALDDLATLDNENLVGAFDGREAMRNDECRSPSSQ